MPALRLGDVIPNFNAETTRGNINFYQWQGNMWAVLFSHPQDFTPVCVSELSNIADKETYFSKRNVKFLALSCDSLQQHLEWEKDIQHYCREIPTEEFPYPIVADESRRLARLLDMFDSKSYNDSLGLTIRALYIIDPKHVLRFSLHYPTSTGRNISEILRVIDSIQLADRIPQIETPINWKHGDKVMIKSDVKEAEIKKVFPGGVETEYIMAKGSIRTTNNYDLF